MGRRNKSKNVSEPKVTTKDYVIFGAVILVILGIFGIVGVAVADPGPEDFAQCLSDNDVVFYGAYWCHNCLEQKKLFGKAISNINYVECSLPDRSGTTAICERENINSYPTWKFNDGTHVTGVQQLSELARRSGCALE